MASYFLNFFASQKKELASQERENKKVPFYESKMYSFMLLFSFLEKLPSSRRRRRSEQHLICVIAIFRQALTFSPPLLLLQKKLGFSGGCHCSPERNLKWFSHFPLLFFQEQSEPPNAIMLVMVWRSKPQQKIGFWPHLLLACISLHHHHHP